MDDYSIGCMNKCGRVKDSRGLCRNCYGKLLDQVKAGTTTWAKLEAAGKCLPAKADRVRRSIERDKKEIGP